MFPQRVVVVGGGTMGAGIAQSFATIGSRITVVEANEEYAAAARDRLRTSLARAEERGKVESAAAVLGLIEVRTDAPPSDADLYVEAVPEDLALKTDVLQRLSAAAPIGVMIATNTSSLPITELAAAVTDPARFIGMHFFNPVPASVLVELIRHDGTADAVIARARGWITALGKESILVRDTPGFATSRLGVAVGLEAIRMLEEGVGSAEDIDTAMRLGYRWPMGPLRLTDLVGLDVRLGIAEHLASTLGDRFTPPKLLRTRSLPARSARSRGRASSTGQPRADRTEHIVESRGTARYAHNVRETGARTARYAHNVRESGVISTTGPAGSCPCSYIQAKIVAYASGSSSYGPTCLVLAADVAATSATAGRSSGTATPTWSCTVTSPSSSSRGSRPRCR